MNIAPDNIMCRLFKLAPQDGHQVVFQLGKHAIQWLGLEVLRLRGGQGWQTDLQETEAALVVMSGHCAIKVRGEKMVTWDAVGGRPDCFSGSPSAAYAPRRSTVEVTATDKLQMAIIRAPCEVDLPPCLIRPDDVVQVSTGAANWRRDVRLVIPPTSPISQRLIVGETLNPTGNWSGIPPHKHDESSEAENALEEFYLFQTKPPDGYGVQLVYSHGVNQAHAVGNDDVIVFLDGYHPTVAAPGTTLYYLWALSGSRRAYDVTVDPRFRWVPAAEAVLREAQHQ